MLVFLRGRLRTIHNPDAQLLLECFGIFLQQPRLGERRHMASEPKTGGNVSVPDQRHTDDRWDSHRPVERTKPGARD